MKKLITHILPSLVLAVGFLFAQADIGETHTLKLERAKLEHQIKMLRADTVIRFMEIQELQQEIISLDVQIFNSYDETVERAAAQKLRQSSNDRLVVFLALGTSLIALFFAIMLFVVRTKVMDGQHSGLISFYRQLSLDFAKKVSPDKSGTTRLLRVNVVVLTGLILMSISILAYLIKSL